MSENEIPPVDHTQICTTDGRSAEQVRAEQAKDGNKLHASYIVLCDEEREKGFVRPVRQGYKHLPCGTTTTMSAAIAETYARDPKFYGSTYCVQCHGHFLVGEHGEFVWHDGTKVGT